MDTTKPPRGFTTAILHSDRDGDVEHGALHKPLHVSVAYGYRDARDLAAVDHGFHVVEFVGFEAAEDD